MIFLGGLFSAEKLLMSFRSEVMSTAHGMIRRGKDGGGMKHGVHGSLQHRLFEVLSPE